MLCKQKVFLFAVSVVFILILPGINSFLSVPSGKLSWGKYDSARIMYIHHLVTQSPMQLRNNIHINTNNRKSD